MRKILKVTGILLLVLLLAVVGLALYIKTGLPNVGDAPDIRVEITPQRVSRGDYLANDVAACMDCHSQRD